METIKSDFLPFMCSTIVGVVCKDGVIIGTEKIVVNKNTLERIRDLCQSRKGPIVFCPTHRSYMDFLLVSLVLFFY